MPSANAPRLTARCPTRITFADSSIPHSGHRVLSLRPKRSKPHLRQIGWLSMGRPRRAKITVPPPRAAISAVMKIAKPIVCGTRILADDHREL